MIKLDAPTGANRVSALALSILFLVSSCFQLSVSAQANATLTVKLVDAIDSDRGTAGQQFRATVSRPVQMGSTMIPVGSPVIVSLVPGAGGTTWTLNLTSLTVGGHTYRILGQSPAVVPFSQAEIPLVQRGTVFTPRRVAVAAGLNVRFTLAPLPKNQPAGNAPAAATGRPGSQPGAVPAAQAPAPSPAGQTAAGNTGYTGVGPGSPPIPTRGNTAPEAGVQIGDPSAVFEAKGFRVKLVGCSKQGGASVTCDFQVTNIGEDGRRMSIGAGHGYGVIDSKGQAIAMTGASLAGTGGWVDTPANIPMSARITSAGVDPDVNSLFRVPFNIRLFPANFAYFEWRNVSLNGPAPAQAAANPPAPAPAAGGGDSSVAEVDGYRFTALRCNSLPSSTPNLNDSINPSSGDYVGFLHLDPTHPLIECFFRVENTKANRGILLDGISLIGNNGNVYNSGSKTYAHPLSMLGWLGEEADYKQSKTIPYIKWRSPTVYHSIAPPERNMGLYAKYNFQNAPDIAAGTPEYFWALFLGPDTTVTEAAQIRLGMRTSRGNGGAGYYQIEANFKNIPIVPISKAAAAAIDAKSAPKPTPSSVTAEVALQKFWDRAISKCGGTWYTRDINDPYHENTKNPKYKETEYKGAKLSPVRKFPVSETDKMNGLEWKASNMLQASALRERYQNDDGTWTPWGDWRQFLIMENPVATVEKKNGKVTYQLTQEVPYEQLDEQVLSGPSCSDFQ